VERIYPKKCNKVSFKQTYVDRWKTFMALLTQLILKGEVVSV